MSTRTPDEQIGSSPAADAQIDDDVRALVEGESMPEETAWAILAAVVARAKREERRRLWQAIDPLMDGVTDDGVRDRLAITGTRPGLRQAYRLGVATALMETAKEADHG